MADLRLTDLTQATGITINDLLHIVIPTDISQDPAGSSYKASVNQLYDGLSGYCIPDLYVSNLHSCSPLNINPLDEGGVYFGSTSGITLDVTNKRIGINTSTPQYTLDIKGSQSNLYFDPTSVGGNFVISGSTGIPRMGMTIPAYLTKPTAGFNLGMRAWNDATFPGYGKVGDAFFYAGNETNGFNILNPPGTGTEDYIRFYAGQTANGTTSDIHIQGSGSTRGYIGINNDNPEYLLDVSGGGSKLYYDPTSVGGRFAVSGETNVPRFGVEVPPYLTKLQATMSIGMRAWDDTLYPDYGNLGDAHLYAGVNAYGLNIISEYGVNSADYIRFYAGQDASSGNTPDMYIQGSGSTRGYVGIGTSSPTEKLEVSGTVKSTSVSATTFTGTSTTMSGTKGTTVLNGSTTTAFLTFSGSNTVGGTGYTDFIRVTNTAAGATTPNKTFRVDSLGSLEIVNNAYNSNLFSLTDSGNLTVTGRVKSSVNYSQTGGGSLVTLGASVTPQTILSVSLTTYGNPVMICAYGDAENTGPGYWSKLQLWRDSTALGAIVHTEGSASSENTPFAFTYIDAPAAGTYTYYLKANEINGGNIKFGESTAPILNAREL